MPSRMVQQLQSGTAFTSLTNLWLTHQAKISFSACLALIAISGWLAGQVIWGVLDTSAGPQRWSPSAVVVANGQAVTSDDSVATLLNGHLFGRYSEKQVVKPVTPTVVDAPKTRLNLNLVGVVASSDPSRSLAIIANRGKQDTYGLEEPIEGTRASLKAVFADRVIIENQGKDETLMLQGIEYSKLSQQVATQSPTSNIAASFNRNELDKIREQITQNPQSVMKYIRLSQVREGSELKGYRVSPGAERELFDAVGLQDGDIAKQLNGADLTDPAAMGQIWQSMNDLTELNLTVERNGQLHDVYIEF
ncbi:type II secretion system protein GspC [Vibrio sp. SCSIO 43136]|uniref:type II secretion system protein GspC n=1 Tax=Vibrio sp. SCSIO 43136 TaxID=2819101 RepID=UPI002074CDCE|nr:type II secretion system protein GspC [Vibrio sp. SCSIO 43136]USD65189.1 type II secretion system protein GspC [Vibrio sp. SCSIO 43136]